MSAKGTQGTLAGRIGGLRLGKAQHYRNMAVIPLFMEVKAGPSYLTLTEALDTGVLKVTEVDKVARVPELKVVNKAAKPVLLLDGEELVGAKQNRVLNASILVAKYSELIVAVSCTEQGRWHYATEHFGDSGVVAAREVRLRTNADVATSLAAGASFRTNQAAVWDEIARLSERADVVSHTGAMRDVFEAREVDLAKCIEAFPHVSGQNGLLVMIDGEVAGFDAVSAPEQYRVLHPKLMKSYAIGALASPTAVPRAPQAADIRRAEAFVSEALALAGGRFKSLGLGWDYRYRNQGIGGSSLVHRGVAVHAAFFRLDDAGMGTGHRREVDDRREDRIRTRIQGYRHRRTVR